MDRRTLTLAGAAVAIAFLLGLVPMWMAKRSADDHLADARQQLQLSRIEGRLGAALTESLRGNFERSRQIMTQVFTDLQAAGPQATDPKQRQAIQGVLSQRDEIITLLSRGQPEVTQRLMLLYTSLFAAVDPQGAVAPSVTRTVAVAVG